LNQAAGIGSHGAKVRGLLVGDPGRPEVHRIQPEHVGRALRNQAELTPAARIIEIGDENEARAEVRLRGSAEHQLHQIDDGNRHAPVIERPGNARRRLWDLLQLHHGENFSDLPRIQHISIVAEPTHEEQHLGDQLETGHAASHTAGGLIESIDHLVRLPQRFDRLLRRVAQLRQRLRDLFRAGRLRLHAFAD